MTRTGAAKNAESTGRPQTTEPPQTTERPETVGGPRGTAAVARPRLALAAIVLAGLLAVLISTWLTLPEAARGIVMPGPLVEYGLPVMRLVLDVAATATVGLSLLPKLLGFDDPERTEPVAARARHWAVLSALVWALSALVSTVLSAAELTPGQAPDVAGFVERIGSGQGLVVSASCAVVSAAVGMFAVRFGEKVPAELRVLVAAFGLLPLPVTGHASNWYWHDLSMVSMELHVIGSAAWVGGLLALAVLLAGNRGLLALALPRFSRLATVALLVVGLTGLFNGVVELLLTPGEEFPLSLVTTGYGQLVIAKIVFVGLVALLGGNIRWRLLPAISRQAPTAFAAWVAFELAVMGLAYGVAVALTRAPVS
ncbi:CopD family protein [Microtetraspora sp. AC03309]|uniref:copper resistance D family protein n=1 Tax=Microtetraspora sp. AC03309 TaxID=2779376 RepID=UPI001E63AFA2|nr:CopD family protein [Microtetraspora sp. AC03309]MCC5578843.1 CopD family protein [Microtetraspora sp. AC03309]